jgi:predicted AAA+ superfamily ATPase
LIFYPYEKDKEDEFDIDNINIKIIPAWKWLLDKTKIET